MRLVLLQRKNDEHVATRRSKVTRFWISPFLRTDSFRMVSAKRPLIAFLNLRSRSVYFTMAIFVKNNHARALYWRGSISIFVRVKDKAWSGRKRARRTSILIKNNSHAGRSLPDPTHPPLPLSAFRQLREPFRSSVDPIGNKDHPCTAPDAFAIFRNHRVS